MLDFEKLGEFNLGKRYDSDDEKLTEELVLYNSKDLTTHAVIIGMTGSGKTGLGIGILEEAALNHIPVQDARTPFQSFKTVAEDAARILQGTHAQFWMNLQTRYDLANPTQ